MDLLCMEYFARVASEKNIANVAKQYHVASSTISTQIKSLEKELGVSLFYRTGNAMLLTNAGARAYEYITEILSLANSAALELKDRNSAIQTINLYVETCPLTFPRIIKGFNDLYPNISWNLIQSFRRPSVDWNTSSLRLHATDQPIRDSNSIVLFQEECLIGICASDPLTEKKTVCLEDLRNRPFIMRSPLSTEINRLIEQSLQKANFLPCTYSYCDNSFLLNKMVSSNMGLTFLPFLTWLHYNDPNIALLRIPELPIIRYINLTWNKNMFLPKCTRDFIEYTVQYFSDFQKMIFSQQQAVITLDSLSPRSNGQPTRRHELS